MINERMYAHQTSDDALLGVVLDITLDSSNAVQVIYAADATGIPTKIAGANVYIKPFDRKR